MASISRLTIIKVLEFLITCICLGIHHESFNCGRISLAMITTGVFVGYVIILVGIVGGYLMKTPVNQKIDIYFSIVGCALFLTAGAMLIDEYQNYVSSNLKDRMLAKGSMSIINAGIFLLDAALTYKGEK